MKLRYFYFAIFCLFYAHLPLTAQSCYVQKTDVSGIDTDQSKEFLNQNACSLIETFPSEFQANFKVLGFGLYRLSAYANGAIEASVAQAKKEAEASSSYYLVFAKISTAKQIYNEFHIELKLPESGIFACLTPSLRSLLISRVQSAVLAAYQEKGNNPYFYALAEVAGIKELKKIVEELKSGSCCPITANEIKEDLESKGFFGIPCQIEIPAARTTPEKRSASSVTDYANLNIQVEGRAFDPKLRLTEILATLSSKGKAGNGYITRNENYCDGNFKSVSDLYTANLTDYDIWFHIWKNPETGGDLFFVRTQQQDDISTTFKDPDVVVNGYRPLYKSRLSTYIQTNCPGTLPLENQIGAKFEEAFIAYGRLNFDPSSGFRANRATFPGVRPTEPDAIADAEGTSPAGVSVRTIDGRWFEVKATYGNIGLSYDDGQIKGHIDNLATHIKPIGLKAGVSELYIVTTYDSAISIDVYAYAAEKRHINIIHLVSMYRMNAVTNCMEIIFGRYAENNPFYWIFGPLINPTDQGYCPCPAIRPFTNPEVSIKK